MGDLSNQIEIDKLLLPTADETTYIIIDVVLAISKMRADA